MFLDEFLFFPLNGFRIQWNLCNMVPILKQLNELFNIRPKLWIGSENVPDQILDFLRHLVFGLTGILWEPIRSWSNSNSIRVHKRMNKITQGIQHTSSHPNISFVIDQILCIRIHNLGWTIHGSRHAFNILLYRIIVFFTDRWEIVCLLRAWTKIAELVVFILTQKHVLYFDVSMIESSLMNRFEPLKNVKGYLYKLCLSKTFVLSLFQQIKQSTTVA